MGRKTIVRSGGRRFGGDVKPGELQKKKEEKATINRGLMVFGPC